jgi:RNA polymerase sigma-70 factor (ECF subfamily)
MAAGEIAIRTAEGGLGQVAAERGLVEQCRRGDAQAFARLVALHEGMVYNLAARLLGDGEEARDLSQEVFLQVYRTLERFEGRSTLKTWIYRIVVNHCRNRQRWWHRRRRAASVPLDALRPADEPRLPDGGPQEQLERRERACAVQEALLRLSFDHRAILLLREVEGLSCRQLAEALGIAEGTVKSRLSRARDELRQRLAPQVGKP